MSSTTSSPATFRPPNRPGHFRLGVLPEYRSASLITFNKSYKPTTVTIVMPPLALTSSNLFPVLTW